MSGQQVGTIVGFVVGAFVGYPQLGAFIGGLIGGAVDPTKLEGPHIGDGRPQTSNEGEPIAWCLGTPDWVQGNIVQISEVREVKKEDDGKGGPVTITYQARQDFCIMAAESCEIRGSTIVGVLMVRCNGQIVYDMRAASNFGAENAKFLQNHVFYYGHEDQMPNPTMEAISGVGNTPAYRGVFTMIGFDVDLTPYGNAIPTYEFVLVGEGEVIEEEVVQYAAPVYGRFNNSDFPLVDPDSLYTFTGRRKTSDTTNETFSANSRAEILQHFGAIGYDGVVKPVDRYIGYGANTGALIGSFSYNRIVDQPDVSDNISLVLVYTEQEPVEYINVEDNLACPLLPYVSPGQPDWYAFLEGTVGRVVSPATHPAGYTFLNNCTNFPNEGGQFPYILGIDPLVIEVEARSAPPSEAPIGDPCLLGVPVKLPGSPGWTIDCEGRIAPEPTWTEVTGDFLALQEEVKEFLTDGRQVFSKKMIGPVLVDGDPSGNQQFWEDAYDQAVMNGKMDAGLVYGDDYPVPVSFAYRGVYTSTSLETYPLSVASAIERIALRGGLEISDIDTSGIDDALLGYAIRSDYNGADCIRPLLTYSASFGSEYDAQLHFHKYGGPIEIEVDELDFIEGSEETDEDTRQQAKEYPKKVSVFYADPEQNYITRPQSASRNTEDIRAIGEETVQLPMVATADRAAQLAEIAIKVNWARAEGIRKFELPWGGYDSYLELVAGFPISVGGKRRAANRITLKDGTLFIEGDYDRQSAYTSNVTGVPAPPPTPPPSTIGGVTLSAFMNLPPLRDQDDRLVIYAAVSSLLPGWPGCSIIMSSDGGASWQTMISQATEQSVIGYLTEPLADASPHGDDTTNVMRVSVHGGELNSITYQQYLNESNPCALVRDDGSAEIVQFRDADDIEEGKYALSYLARGRLGTRTDAHPARRRFVSLDSVYTIEIPSSLRGKKLLFKAVTLGTSPETVAPTEIVFQPAYSQYEHPPAHLTTERDGDELTLSIVPVHRLGTAASPVPSQYMKGYEFDATDGVNVAHREPTSPSTTISVAGWSSPITVTVRQVNTWTGAGEPLTVEVEI